MTQVKNKLQAGFTIIELLIVIAIIGILATLVLTNFQGAQARGRDTVRNSDINAVFTKLEEYYTNNQNQYPAGDVASSTLPASSFPGIDESALIDEDGDPIEVTLVDSATAPTIDPDTDTEYILQFYGAGCAAATPDACEKYVIGAFQEVDGNDDVIKNSLN